jgi:hypothetical protein
MKVLVVEYCKNVKWFTLFPYKIYRNPLLYLTIRANKITLQTADEST